MTRSVLWVTAALLIGACEDATEPKNTATLPSPPPMAATAVSSFRAEAVLSSHLATIDHPITYTVDFGRRFKSISNVRYFFTFGDDPLNLNDCLMIFLSDAALTGGGFCNGSATAQTSRQLDFPCATHAVEGCDPFRDGVSGGELRAMYRLVGNPPVSVSVKSFTITIDGETAAAGMWRPMPPVGLARWGTGAAVLGNSVLGNSVVVVGGLDRLNSVMSRVDAYNVKTKTWSQLRSLPDPRAFFAGVTTISGKLYVAGGRRSDAPNTPSEKTLFVYDPGTNAWTRKADMPDIACGGVQGNILGNLYVFTPCATAGSPGPGVGWRFFMYNPGTDKWVRLPLPSPHLGGMGGVINGKFYLVGGVGIHGSVTGNLDVYDPATRTWTAKRPMAVPRTDAFAATLHGKLFIAGGQKVEAGFLTSTNELEVYDPVTDRWVTGPSMPSRRGAGASAMADGKIFTIAGLDEQRRVVTKVEAYNEP